MLQLGGYGMVARYNSRPCPRARRELGEGQQLFDSFGKLSDISRAAALPLLAA